MRINIPQFAKGAAASSTLTIVGVCIGVVVLAVPIIAVSFSAMALWKSPESVPSLADASLSYDASGTPQGLGDLVKDCPAVKALGADNLANYNKWVPYINAGAQGTSASPALVTAILYAGEHGNSFPNPAGECTSGSNCVHGWYKSPEPYNAYGPFQFQNGTWWDNGMTKEERQAAYDSGKVTDRPIQNGVPLSDSIYDPGRAAKGAATYLGANMDHDDGPTLRDKIESAIFLYNHRDDYKAKVYSAYLVFAGCLTSSQVSSVVLTGDKANDVVNIALHEASLLESKSVPPPLGYHTKNADNYVKYLNSDLNDTSSQNSAPWCAAFVNWVYRKAGYQMEFSASNDYLISFFSASDHTFLLNNEIKNPAKEILPGDVLIMNSNTSNSGYHAGIVTKVDPNGTIHTVEGNLGTSKNNRDRVAIEDNHTLSQTINGTSELRIYGVGRW